MRICTGVVLTCAFVAVTTMGTAQALTANDIVAKANHTSLYQGEDFRGSITMQITSKQGFTRQRQFNMLRKDEGNGDGNQKYFVFFRKPADVRKMVFMVHKKADLNAHDDRWLYMPSLDLVRRIAASDKRTSFVGSDFLYEDISGRNPAEDDHQIVADTAAHYVLRSTPKHSDEVEFAYYLTTIDKQTFVPKQIVFFKAGDQKYRAIEAQKVEMVSVMENGTAQTYPTVVQSVAENFETGSKTVMTLSRLHYNMGVKTGIFTERYLRRPPREVMR